MVQRSFTWKDGERTIHFGDGAVGRALPAIGTGFVLLRSGSGRAGNVAGELAGRAGTVLEVRAGRVDEIAGELLGELHPAAQWLVALGGGRVIDVAKALAAARDPHERPRVAAIPTTLSAAEMTAVHRRAAGADPKLPGTRPAIVANDPLLSASQPPQELAASAANALGHAAEGPLTIRATPVPALAGREAARLIGAAYADPDDPDRDTLALGALLSGYSIDGNGYGLHHVLSQTLARCTAAGHGQANAAMLPHSLLALAQRGAPDAGELMGLAAGLADRAGATRLRDLGVSERQLDECAGTAAGRAELDMTPPRADRDELRGLYAAAY